MAAPAYVASGSGPTNTTTAVTIPKPAGTLAGHVLYALVTNGGAGTAPGTVPDGWGLRVGLATGAGGWAGIYEHVAGGVEPSSYMWSGFTDSCAGSMIAVSGADTTAPTHKSSAQANLDSSAPTCGGVTTEVAECLIVGGIGVGDNVSVSGWTATDPATLTERVEVQSSGGADTTSSLAAATGAQSAPGPTGTLNVTLAGSRNSIVFVLAVQPPQEGGGSEEATVSAVLPAIVGEASGTVAAHGDAAADLPPADASAAGAVRLSGGVSATYAPLDGSLAGTVTDLGAANASLSGVEAPAAGLLRITGGADAALPGTAAQLATGQHITGHADVVLPAPATEFGTGAPDVDTTLTADLPALTANAAARLTIRSGANAALPAAAADAGARATVEAAAASTLPGADGLLQASSPGTTGTLAARLPSAAAAATGTLTIRGGLDAPLPAAAVSGEAEQHITGDLAAVLPSPSATVTELEPPGEFGTATAAIPATPQAAPAAPSMSSATAAAQAVPTATGGSA
ncbi:hypothetical protein GCM10010182_67580 [Actinomadura cremea]|nr:hypothetical protein GCM10010182_67580 [Actinomadura cremea]